MSKKMFTHHYLMLHVIMDNTSEVRGTKLSEALQIQELLCYDYYKFKNQAAYSFDSFMLRRKSKGRNNLLTSTDKKIRSQIANIIVRRLCTLEDSFSFIHT
jgi:hypothetical protein